MIWSLGRNKWEPFRQPVNLPLQKRLAFFLDMLFILLIPYAYFSTQTPLFLSIFQHYCSILYHSLLFISVPEAVQLINTTVRSDTSLIISWKESHKPNGPQESVRYQLAISHLAPIPETPLRQSEFPNGRLTLLVTGLSGGNIYVLKVQ